MPDETGPWWVEDTETGHRFVSTVQAEHLKVLDESPYNASGEYRTAEPAESGSGKGKSSKEASK